MIFGIPLPNLSGDSREIDEEVAKEWEHTVFQNSMDKELHELNRRLEEKEVFSVQIILPCINYKIISYKNFILSLYI